MKEQDYPMNLPKFEKIYIDKSSDESEVAARVRSLYPKEIIYEIDTQSLAPDHPDHHLILGTGSISADEFNRSKKHLLLTTFKGQFFKRCPGATQKKSLTCCNYYVLNLGSQCNMNCSYCYLQSYLNSRITKIYTNINQALVELSDMATTHLHQDLRVGTGEIIDSLSLDPITLYSRQLIQFFNKYPRWTVEFKTKSAQVSQFLDIPTIGNTVVSWSINPQYIIENEEHGTASIEERLQAARLCVKHGFKIAFHIDPMIWHPDWKENYAELANQINENFSPKDVSVISIGALRFQPEQRHMMRERFGMTSLVNQAEMFPSEGNKWRYDALLRSEMFQFLINKMKSLHTDWRIFLCMETPETWLRSFEKIPSQMPELRDLFKPL